MSRLSAPETAVRVLQEIRELLLRFDVHEHANYIAELINAYEDNPAGFWRAAVSGDVWGSAGSLVDWVFRGNVPGSYADLSAADHRYVDLLAQLGLELERKGIATPRIRQWVRLSGRSS